LPIDPGEVSAVLVTRGNVDLSPVLDSLIFEDVVVWSNMGVSEIRGRMSGGARPATR
jgi:hypothetical protein